MSLVPADVERMTSTLYIDGPVGGRKSSRFWVLLILAGVIATAGVIADSTATVIGAMIVAPLMTPILGTALAIVLANRIPLIRSVLLVLLGALAVVAIGYLFGLLAAPLDGFASNGQVTARISPKMIDLIAALATGLVGAFALVRSDISDTLPGVAIAISLVPPLAVVGLLLSVGRYSDAGGAALLFGTNVAAIIATGAIVFLGYRLRDAATAAGAPVGQLRGSALAVIAAMVVIVAIPLTAGSIAVARDQALAWRLGPVAEDWASGHGWQVADVTARRGTVTVSALGLPPDPNAAELRAALDESGYADTPLIVRLVAGESVQCPVGESACSPLASSTRD
jgi:uncharacterized hydrophobic protein (TIGR00271 family)